MKIYQKNTIERGENVARYWYELFREHKRREHNGVDKAPA